MSLFKPTHVFPSHTIGRGGGVIDASLPFSPSWRVDGTVPLIAYRYRIMQNTAASTVVYDSGKISITPVYPVNYLGQPQYFTAAPVPAGTLVNGYENGYKSEITQWWSATDSFAQVSPSFFITRKTPTLEIRDFASPHSTRTLEFIADYEQADGTPLAWFRWKLANDPDRKNIIYDSGQIHNSADIRFIYDSLFTGTDYYVTVSGETQDGVSVEAPWTPFRVDYPLELVQNALTACAETRKSAVRNDWGKFAIINGKPLNDNYSYRNHIPVFGHNSINIGEGNRILYDEVTGRPMSLPKNLTYVWSGAFEQTDYYPLQIFGEDDLGNTNELSLRYTEGAIDGILCEIAIPKSELMPNVPLIFGEPKNSGYRFLKNTPSKGLGSIEIDSGNEIVFDKTNNIPLSFPYALNYAWSGSLSGSADVLTINGKNAFSQNTTLSFVHTQYYAHGILCETLTPDTIHAGKTVLIAIGVPDNADYSFVPDGDSKLAVKIGDNSITFDKINDAPFSFSKAPFAWSGLPIAATGIDAETDIILFQILGDKPIRADFKLKTTLHKKGLFPSKTLFPSKSLFPSRNTYKHTWTLSILESGVLAATLSGDTISKDLSPFESFAIVIDSGLSVSWTAEGVTNVHTTPIALTGSTQTGYVIGDNQICRYFMSGAISSAVKNSILYTPGYIPACNSDTTNLMCLFDGEQFMKYSYSDLILNGRTLASFSFLLRGGSVPPDIFKDDLCKLIIKPDCVFFGRIKPNGAAEYAQSAFPGIAGEFGNTVGIVLSGYQICNYILVTEEEQDISAHLSKSFEPVLTPLTHLLCLFGGMTNVFFGTISLLINGILQFSLNIVKQNIGTPISDIIAGGWWNIAISSNSIYANWFDWNPVETDNWSHHASIQGDYDLFFTDIIDAGTSALPGIERFFTGGAAASTLSPGLDGGNAFTAHAFYTTSVILNGKQSCDYLWIVNSLTADELLAISYDLTFEPEWTAATQLLARFNNSLAAGNIFEQYDVIIGVKLWRRDLTHDVMEYVGERSLHELSFLDYAAKSRIEYQYVLWAVGNIGFGSPVLSNVVTPYFWGYSILDCEETGVNVFRVLKEYLFTYNVESGAAQNNAVIEKFENFTRYPKHMISPQNYASGTFSGLIGYIENNRYIDTQDTAQEIFDLSTNGHPKFFKDRAGSLRKIVLLPSSIKTADTTFEQTKTASISWEEDGDVTGVRITD